MVPIYVSKTWAAINNSSLDYKSISFSLKDKGVQSHFSHHLINLNQSAASVIELVDICSLPLLPSAVALLCHQIIPQRKYPWRRYSEHPDGPKHKATFPVSVSLQPQAPACTLIISIFIHLFHDTLVTVAIIPALPPFLVSSFIVHIFWTPYFPSTIFASFPLFPFFTKCLQCILASFISSLAPTNPFSFNSTPRKFFFFLPLPDGD